MGVQPFYVNVRLESPGPCYKCGITFAMPDNILRVHREKGTSFFCPNGHSQCFMTTEVDRLKQQLQAVRGERDWAQKARDFAQRQAAAQKGNVTKLKRRIKNGVCPCCNRSFENLARHMAGQHPDFAPEKIDGDAQVKD